MNRCLSILAIWAFFSLTASAAEPDLLFRSSELLDISLTAPFRQIDHQGFGKKAVDIVGKSEQGDKNQQHSEQRAQQAVAQFYQVGEEGLFLFDLLFGLLTFESFTFDHRCSRRAGRTLATRHR